MSLRSPFPGKLWTRRRNAGRKGRRAGLGAAKLLPCFLAANACSQQGMKAPQPGASTVPTICPVSSATKGAQLNIIGGVETASYPQVLQVRVTAADGSMANCTGSFHTQELMLTAAHCLHAISGGRALARVSLEGSGEQAIDWFYNPAYLPPDNAQSYAPTNGIPYHRAALNRYRSKTDLAAIRFRASPAHLIVPISAAPRSAGQAVRLIGWGVTAEDLRAQAAGYRASPSRKREALSAIFDLYDDVLVLQEGGEGLLPRLAQGDSGGTVFDAANGQALAVVSSGILPSEAAYQQALANPILSQVGPRLGVAVDLAAPSARAFYGLIQQRWGIAVPFATPSPLPVSVQQSSQTPTGAPAQGNAVGCP